MDYLPATLASIREQRSDRSYEVVVVDGGSVAERGYCPEVLVENSVRRIADAGLTGTLYLYLRLDWGRVTADY